MGWRSKSDEGRAGAREPIENVLGRSLVVRGDLRAEGAFRVDGTVEGALESRAAVVVGESGIVRGDVHGSDVVVAGQIHGNVTCSGHLEILAKGQIHGDIDAQSVRIETGGVFRGTSHMGQASGSGVVRSSGSGAVSGVGVNDGEARASASQRHLSPVA
jgi:cytoskeletal protein CcmA (bactofilin family)